MFGCVRICASESRDNGLSPGERGERMTSVVEGWAGGKRDTSDHGLPSLVNRVSDQAAPTQLENGDDERILDRMGAQQRTDSCRETAEIVQKREAWELGGGGG